MSRKSKTSFHFLEVTNQSEVYTSFRGPMITYFIIQSIDRNKGELRRWKVISNGRPSTLINRLFGKWLWDELNDFEARIFFHLACVTKDISIYSCLKARALGIPKKTIRQRLEKISKLLNIKFISRQQYLSIEGRGIWLFAKETVNLRVTTKYSGYTKHYKDKGSLGFTKDTFVSELFEPLLDVNKEQIILEYLSIGKLGNFGELHTLP